MNEILKRLTQLVDDLTEANNRNSESKPMIESMMNDFPDRFKAVVMHIIKHNKTDMIVMMELKEMTVTKFKLINNFDSDTLVFEVDKKELHITIDHHNDGTQLLGVMYGFQFILDVLQLNQYLTSKYKEFN